MYFLVLTDARTIQNSTALIQNRKNITFTTIRCPWNIYLEKSTYWPSLYTARSSFVIMWYRLQLWADSRIRGSSFLSGTASLLANKVDWTIMIYDYKTVASTDSKLFWWFQCFSGMKIFYCVVIFNTAYVLINWVDYHSFPPIYHQNSRGF